MAIDYEDYLDAGMYIFPLYRIMNGACECEDPECKVPGKHPRMGSWQYVTTWDEEQIATMTNDNELLGYNQFEQGFGVNLDGQYLVVDVDARNGGVESYKKLCSDTAIDLVDASEFAVATGSGGGSMHIYFDTPKPPLALMQSHPSYPGIDFKSTGFVVGSGSDHISGSRYEAIKGNPKHIAAAPESLITLLRRPDRVRTVEFGKTLDFSMQELASIVMHINNDEADYEQWVRVGMGLHEATAGNMDGYAIWVEWSQMSGKHDEKDMPMKWRSFGEGKANNVTVGTLVKWAQDCGYVEPVTFESVEHWDDIPADERKDCVTDKSVYESVNLKKPPGMVGELTEWINSRSLFPREQLSVGAALYALSSAAGMRHRVGATNVTLNLIVFGIASSGTGKESIISRIIDCFTAAGIQSAAHGGIKSEQEIIRNITRNQAALYVLDEIGSILAKLGNAKKGGGAAYLEAVIPTMISIFSKANDSLIIGGDLKHELKEKIQKEIASTNKKLDKGEGSEADLDRLLKELDQVDNGIQNPFLSVYGTSEPFTFAGAIDREMMVSGFMGRAIVFEEHNNVPRRKPMSEFCSDDMPRHIADKLRELYQGGHASMRKERVERQGKIVSIDLDDEAKVAADDVYEYFHNMACAEQDAGTGLEPIPMRGWETTLKVAGTLAVVSGVVTIEHMRYAFALVNKATVWKLDKGKAAEGAETKDINERSSGVIAAVLSSLDKTELNTFGVIKNKYRNKYDPDQLQQAIDHLVSVGKIISVTQVAKNRRSYDYYRLA